MGGRLNNKNASQQQNTDWNAVRSVRTFVENVLVETVGYTCYKSTAVDCKACSIETKGCQVVNMFGRGKQLLCFADFQIKSLGVRFALICTFVGGLCVQQQLYRERSIAIVFAVYTWK